MGAGEESEKFNTNREIFGCSGALAIYKRETLDDCLIKTKFNSNGEYFDEDFFVYKEDVDLAWRSRLFGWKSMLIVEAVAYHIRSAAGSEHTGLMDIIKNRKKQSFFARYYSYRNHLLLLLKNEMSKNFLNDFWQIKCFEIKKAVYVLMFEIRSVQAWWEILKMLPRILAKRKEIIRKTKISYQDMAKLIQK